MDNICIFHYIFALLLRRSLQHVSAARFWSTPLKENYLCTSASIALWISLPLFYLHNSLVVIALRNGAVNSYLLDEVEEIQESEFMNFLSGRWNMLIGKRV